YCRDIGESGRYLLDVINDILDMSKIEAGRTTLSFETFDLDPFLADIMRLVADRRTVKQIVINLLSNAVKFTPDGGRITVRARIVGGNVNIAIEDTGIGIPKEALKNLGKPFEQVESQL